MNEAATPNLLDTPIGINAAGKRRETDSMGDIDVPADRYWGAQTERSRLSISRSADDRMPKRVYHAYGYVKKAAALVNAAAGRLPQWRKGCRHHALPTRQSRASSTSTFRSMSGRLDRAPSRI